LGQEIKELIHSCMNLQSNRIRLSAILISFLPPSMIAKDLKMEIPKETLVELREEGEQLGGWEEVINKEHLIEKDLDNKLSELAEYLEEKEPLEKIKAQLCEDQYSWLISHISEIKNHLRGIKII